MYLQSATWFIGSIMSQLKTSWPMILIFLLWYIYYTLKASAASIPIHGSASSTYVSCRLYVCRRFHSNWCIVSMISFSCGFPGEYGLVLIPYPYSVKLFLNSWPINYSPQSYLICTGHGYRTSHVVSTNFAIIIAFLFLYCVTSNHPVMGSIIVTSFNIRGSFPF